MFIALQVRNSLKLDASVSYRKTEAELTKYFQTYDNFIYCTDHRRDALSRGWLHIVRATALFRTTDILYLKKTHGLRQKYYNSQVTCDGRRRTNNSINVTLEGFATLTAVTHRTVKTSLEPLSVGSTFSSIDLSSDSDILMCCTDARTHLKVTFCKSMTPTA